jgi:hypothetical protein
MAVLLTAIVVVVGLLFARFNRNKAEGAGS